MSNLRPIKRQAVASEQGQQSHSNNEWRNDDFIIEEDSLSDNDLSMDMEWDFSFASDDQGDDFGVSDVCSNSSGEEVLNDLDYSGFVLKLQDWCIRSTTARDFMDELLTLLREICIPVPKCTKTLLQTPKRAVQPRVMEPGEATYFGIENMLIECNHPSLRDADEIVLKISSDGVPLCKSSKSQLIPLNGEVAGNREIPVFPILVYHGTKKPKSVDDYFEEFSCEAVRLMRDGVMVTSEKVRKPFSILNFVGDAPQRAFMKGVRGHTCKHGCLMCDQVGKKINNRMTYSTTRGLPRIDESFNARSDPEHHQPEFLNQPTTLESLGFGMTTQFPVETMHLIDQGVQKKILKLIVAKRCNVKITDVGLRAMERKMLELYHFIHRAEFARRPRSFTELARWKATEFRLFALYIGIVVLKDNVPEDLYNHQLHMTCAYRLISTSNAKINCETENTLFDRYVENFPPIYGAEYVSYNVHNLLHICECVERYGEVNEFTAYRYENFLQQMKKFVRKPSKVLQQISNRIQEVKFLNTEVTKTGFLYESRPMFPGCPSYNGYKFDQFLLRQTLADAYCGIAPNIQFQVEQFGILNDEEVVIGRRFLTSEPFFDSPMDSREVGIFMCSELSQEVETFPLKQVQNKFINLPYEDKNVLVAMLHHIK